MTMKRHKRVAMALLAGLGIALGGAAAAQPAGGAQDAAPGARPTIASTPWSRLSPEQRELLAPLQADWNTLPPRKQAHMLDKSRQWLALPPPEQEKIRDRIARWHQMTPEQRKLARDNMRKFHQLPEAQRDQLHQAYQHFQQLPPAQRERLLKQWRSQTIEQRQQWLRENRYTEPVPANNSDQPR
jgi:hypothetical protein